MAWFKRKEKGITTSTEEKKDIPKGLWYKSPTGKVVDSEELAKNFYVSPEDGYHVRIGSKEYFEILFDDNKFKELDKDLSSRDPLKFEDTKKYPDRLKAAQEKTKLTDAVRCAVGKSKGKDLVVAAMDFSFIGGSMGSVVGEKIARAADYALKNKLPFMIISKSGGARMMEAALSLMQSTGAAQAVQQALKGDIVGGVNTLSSNIQSQKSKIIGTMAAAAAGKVLAKSFRVGQVAKLGPIALKI